MWHAAYTGSVPIYVLIQSASTQREGYVMNRELGLIHRFADGTMVEVSGYALVPDSDYRPGSAYRDTWNVRVVAPHTAVPVPMAVAVISPLVILQDTAVFSGGVNREMTSTEALRTWASFAIATADQYRAAMGRQQDYAAYCYATTGAGPDEHEAYAEWCYIMEDELTLLREE